MKIILIIIIVYYGFQFVVKYILPFVLKKAVDKVQNNMKNQQEQRENPDKPVGETSVDFAPKNDTSNNKVGEYIEFEEVDSKTKETK